MAPQFTRDDVLGIAALAHLELDDRELQQFADQLAHILEYADVVQQVDTTGVPPMSHVTAPAGAAWRDDVATGSLNRQDVLAQAPDPDDAAGLFRVPKVL